MTPSALAPNGACRTRAAILAALVVMATLLGVAGCSSSSPKPTALGSTGSPRRDQQGASREPDIDVPRTAAPRLPAGTPTREQRAGRGRTDAVPNGTTVFDDDVPAVINLQPSLLRTLRRAAREAAPDGVEFSINSGWRSRKHQERLFRAAVAKYGSTIEAARWVARPGTSVHEKGRAVDLGGSHARAWLSRHGAEYGLCQIYRNEPWHFELRPAAVDDGCPRMYADPTHDPRLQR